MQLRSPQFYERLQIGIISASKLQEVWIRNGERVVDWGEETALMQFGIDETAQPKLEIDEKDLQRDWWQVLMNQPVGCQSCLFVHQVLPALERDCLTPSPWPRSEPVLLHTSSQAPPHEDIHTSKTLHLRSPQILISSSHFTYAHFPSIFPSSQFSHASACQVLISDLD